MKPVIGILGGMGPRATVRFEQLLMDRLPGTDQDLPTIVSINDGSVPDRSSYLLGKGDDPLPHLLRNLFLLERMEPTVIAMPCNTACAPAILSRLQAETKIPIIDLPLEVGKYVKNLGLESICILATEGTIKAKVYQAICQESGVSCQVPSPSLQSLVNTVIRAVKGNDLRKAERFARLVRKEVSATGCHAVILGCTELPLVLEALVPSGVLPIDTLDLLARVCVDYTDKIVNEERTYETRRIYN